MAKKRIQFVRCAAPIGYAYMAGQEIETSEGFADELIELGYAITCKKQSGLPEDFPGYKVLLENGYTSVEELTRIATVDQLVEIKGIGKKLAEAIVQRLKA